MDKVCIKCKLSLDLNCFYKHKKTKDGFHTMCKKCFSEHYKNVYKIKNNEIKNNSKEYRKNNPNYLKEYRNKNKSKISNYNKDYYKENIEKINTYLSKTRKHRTQVACQYQKERKKRDPLFKFSCGIKSLISDSIRKRGYKKESKTFDILGCSFDEFKIWIENQFKEGMNWENYGKWHIDHIYPTSLSISKEHIIELNHYKNLQPMWGIENIKKGNKIPQEFLKTKQ